MAQHTPGPWELVGTPEPFSKADEHKTLISYYYELEGPDKKADWIASLSCGDWDHAIEFDRQQVEILEANLRLIAAAPSLLDALRGLLAVAPTSDGLQQLLRSLYGSVTPGVSQEVAAFRAARLRAETLVHELSSEGE